MPQRRHDPQHASTWRRVLALGYGAVPAMALAAVALSACVSLPTDDVSAVHAGYVRYRERLLRAGVQLYEVKATARIHEKDRTADKREKGGLTGSSWASLHAKSFAFDRREMFIGSLNLDPRSIELNTEIGVLFETPEGGDLFAEGFERIVSENAFRLELTESGRLEWVSDEDGRETRFTTEPNSSVWRRMGVWFLQWMPIEHQLEGGC